MREDLERLYANRFDERDRAWKQVVWRILWRRVFRRWIGPEDRLLDLGAGYCEFVNSATDIQKFQNRLLISGLGNNKLWGLVFV